jgi:hypothetical protein
MDDACVLVANQKISAVKDLLPVLELPLVGRGRLVHILRHGGPLLVERLGAWPTPITR